MKKGLLILGLGGLVCLGVCGGLYCVLTAPHRAMLESQNPELAWLRQEFELTPAQFEIVSRLHDGYLPQCAALCAQIEERNVQVRRHLGEIGEITPEVDSLLQEASDLRLSCQRMMLRHFVEVSRAMSPGQGRRYLAWVQQKTLFMQHEPGMTGNGSPPHHHGH